MSQENIEHVYSLVTPLEEPIENKSDYSGIATESFKNGDKFEGNFERGVNLKRKKREKENTHLQMEMFTKENLPMI